MKQILMFFILLFSFYTGAECVEGGDFIVKRERLQSPRSALVRLEKPTDSGTVEVDFFPHHQRSNRACIASLNNEIPPLPPVQTNLLRLVNKENPLAEDYKPSDLVKYNKIELCEVARDAFVEMVAAMELEGINGLRLQSAYRSYSYQRAIFNEKARELLRTGKATSKAEAEEIAARSIQPPGASEHQLGLALDVSIDGKLSQKFAETEAGRWLAENCHKHGFIIRYPKEKTTVTEIIYEPWHLRFVGAEHAEIMFKTGLTLEEYCSYLATG
jgi:D-alanyl-D-alanine carboxypeptidase